MRGLAEPRKAGRCGDAGFTLLEILVTLVVSGAVLVMLTQGLRVGLRGWAVAQGIGAGTATMETTDLALRGLLDRASPGDRLTYDRAFTGTPTSMAFTTTMPDQLGGSVPLEADVSVVSDGRHLILRWRPHHARWIGAPSPQSTELLADGVIGLQMAYFQAGSGGRWLTSWSSPDLPRLVRIHFVFARDNRQQWPDVVAETMRERAPR
jgi:prepilin-type N-terminal cleavage/methylation domain-containing protein